MSAQSSLFNLAPWIGGLNDSADPGAIPANDFTVYKNCLASTSGVGIKRPGFAYLDNMDLPAIESVAVASNIVTIVFKEDIVETGVNAKLVIGETINVNCPEAPEINAQGAPILNVTGDDTITYSLVYDGTLTLDEPIVNITRASNIIATHDFWYFNQTLLQKERAIIAVTSQGKIFKYVGSGFSFNRLELTMKTYSVSANAAADTDASTDRILFTGHGLKTGCALRFTSLTGGTGLSTTKVYYVEVYDANKIYLTETPGGARVNFTTDISAGTMAVPFNWDNTVIENADIKTYNEKCFIATEGINNWPIMIDLVADSSTYTTTKGPNPNASVMQVYEGRLLMNDKAAKETLHYCSTYNHTEWQGLGDSGLVEIGVGSGDPSGILSILPPFKGVLFVSTENTLYRLPDPGIAASRVETVAIGAASVAHGAATAINMDDVIFYDKKGFASLAATNAYGDFTSASTSKKIQKLLSTVIESRKRFTKSVHISYLNLLVVVCSTGNLNENDTTLVFNTEFKTWGTWTGPSIQSVNKFLNADGEQLIVSTSDSRLGYLQKAIYTDFNDTAINHHIKTGKIYVDGNSNTTKTFKRLGLQLPPKGAFNFSVKIYIDNQPLDTTFPDGSNGAGSFVIAKEGSGDLLDSTFILGISVLGYKANMDPFMRTIDGVGRGIVVEIESNNVGEQTELYGLLIEYVPAGLAQETNVSGSTTE